MRLELARQESNQLLGDLLLTHTTEYQRCHGQKKVLVGTCVEAGVVAPVYKLYKGVSKAQRSLDRTQTCLFASCAAFKAVSCIVHAHTHGAGAAAAAASAAAAAAVAARAVM